MCIRLRDHPQSPGRGQTSEIFRDVWFPTPISQAELWLSEESRPGLAWLGPGLFSG